MYDTIEHTCSIHWNNSVIPGVDLAWSQENLSSKKEFLVANKTIILIVQAKNWSRHRFRKAGDSLLIYSRSVKTQECFLHSNSCNADFMQSSLILNNITLQFSTRFTWDAVHSLTDCKK